MGRKILGLVVVVVIISVYSFMNRGDDSADIRAEMQEIVRQLPCYDDNAEYLDTLFERHHDRAFDESYTMGRRRRAAEFDPGAYVVELYGRMIRSARDHGEAELVRCLQAERDTLVAGDQ